MVVGGGWWAQTGGWWPHTPKGKAHRRPCNGARRQVRCTITSSLPWGVASRGGDNVDFGTTPYAPPAPPTKRKRTNDFYVSRLAQLPSGARASHIREFPIHGYVEPSVLHPCPNSGKLMISMCRDWPNSRLAPDPATFRSFLYVDPTIQFAWDPR